MGEVNTPVLLLVFNRPDHTARLIQRLRDIRPQRMFVAADGPRRDHSEDPVRCAAVRRIIDGIDWSCDVQRLYQFDNLGCKAGPETGLTWFFDHVHHGVILEDDCIPDPAFFSFAAELLERYEQDRRVMMISGTNRLGRWERGGQSYHFSRHAHVWGWATWRRAWRLHDVSLAAWDDPAVRSQLHHLLGDEQYRIRARQFEAVRRGAIDTWDYGWMCTVLQHGTSVVPSVNLVTNIGFGRDATHTHNEYSNWANLPTHELQFPLRHPPSPNPDDEYDAAVAAVARPRFPRLQTVLPAGAKRLALRSLSQIGRLRSRHAQRGR